MPSDGTLSGNYNSVVVGVKGDAKDSRTKRTAT